MPMPAGQEDASFRDNPKQLGAFSDRCIYLGDRWGNIVGNVLEVGKSGLLFGLMHYHCKEPFVSDADSDASGSSETSKPDLSWREPWAMAMRLARCAE